MRNLVRYAVAALALLAIAVAGSTLILDERGRLGLLIAALVAFPVQLLAFGLLLWGRRHPERFLAAWGVGILGRIAVLATLALAVRRIDEVGNAALVLGLAGFLFVLALMEPLFLPPHAARGDRGSD